MSTIAIAGCMNGDNAVEPTVSLAGTYSLRTINGSPLPFTFSTGTTLNSDVLTLFGDGTYSDASQYADGSVRVEQGTYDNISGAINFFPQGSISSYQGSLSGSILTEIFNGFTQVFQKN